MVGLKIKEIRERNKLSREYVAIQMEMSLSQYSKIETENVDLKLSKLDKLVKIIGAKKSELFTLDYK
ncbi:helix-turn-helix domain-containing protein [Flavobacterium sp. AC]|uniref:Helix-turn-helix domain-containing protein n=1 Tax=Flavobacterium azizsancarii TaxID=2961580 RepID=A0ABT4WG58_9FLAO|nr:helix-turn-helix transcriptional regulator [Flavobacterium azizsancarii]MDA6071541.1 helix-turn-helix domain-containing protein [Flavobacterium azizsancarii]